MLKGETGRLVRHSFSDGGSLLCVRFFFVFFVFFALFLDRHSLGDVCCGYSFPGLRGGSAAPVQTGRTSTAPQAATGQREAHSSASSRLGTSITTTLPISSLLSAKGPACT